MEFGVLFTAQPNPIEEPHSHRDVHVRTTDEVVARDKAMRSRELFAERVAAAA